MFCPNCGATTEGKFCEKCGAAVNAGAASGTFTGPGATGANAPPVASAPGLQMNIAAALCYFPLPVITPIIFLLIDPYKRDGLVRFSAFQSLFVSLAFFIVNLLMGVILVNAGEAIATLYTLVRVGELVLFLFLAFKAFQNEKFVLPTIGPLAQKQV